VIVLGLMSGTSVDGIDAAVVEIDEQGDELRLRVLGYRETPHDRALRERVLRLIQPASSRIDEACRLNVEIGEAFARAAREELDALGVRADLVCSHGQTVWHEVRPDGSVAATLQIGEPSVIAERLGVTVVADFRPRDVAAPEKARAIQNLGGIGNVTWLPPGGAVADFLAFDTGPGNALIDLAVGRLTGQRFDEDGRLAAAGRADEAELARLLAHPYFAMPPPKSTGRELFSAAFADAAIDRMLAAGRSPADVVATLTRLTARTVADQYRRFLPRRPDEVVLGGGGARNPTLRAWLAEELGGARLLDHDDFGLPSGGREAIYFAVMGYQALHGRPNTVPACTGARHPVVMGKIVPGANYAALTRGIRPEVQVRRMRVAAGRSASG
jgi:anhydro-N-acetylmuramic acid kinase